MSACWALPPSWFSVSREDPLLPAGKVEWRFINVPVFWSREGLERGFHCAVSSLHFQFHAWPCTPLCLLSSLVSGLNSPDCTHLSASYVLPLSPWVGAKVIISALVHEKVIWESHLLFTLTFHFSNNPPFQSPALSQSSWFFQFLELSWVNWFVFSISLYRHITLKLLSR